MTAIEKSFLEQCEEKTKNVELNHNRVDVWAKERVAYENKIIALETEKKSISSKYEQLKAKHVKLLQVLMQLETKNQKLEMHPATETISVPKLDNVQLQVSSKLPRKVFFIQF